MTTIEQNMSMLKLLENCELAGVIFIMDYVQFQFEGVNCTRWLHAYTWPQVKIENSKFAFTQHGYRDALCALINKHVMFADETKEELFIRFEGDMVLTISLKDEDRECVEAAMLQAGLECEVWR